MGVGCISYNSYGETVLKVAIELTEEKIKQFCEEYDKFHYDNDEKVFYSYNYYADMDSDEFAEMLGFLDIDVDDDHLYSCITKWIECSLGGTLN